MDQDGWECTSVGRLVPLGIDFEPQQPAADDERTERGDGRDGEFVRRRWMARKGGKRRAGREDT